MGLGFFLLGGHSAWFLFFERGSHPKLDSGVAEVDLELLMLLPLSLLYRHYRCVLLGLVDEIPELGKR